MSGVAAAADAAVERARLFGSPTRVYLQPNGTLTLANQKQFKKELMWSLVVGVYTKECPPAWIREDIEAALNESKHICPSCGQPYPR